MREKKETSGMKIHPTKRPKSSLKQKSRANREEKKLQTETHNIYSLKKLKKLKKKPVEKTN